MTIEEIKKLRKEQEDEVERTSAASPAVRLNIDTLQATFERTWKAIENAGGLKDLTNLKTESELHKAVVVGGVYKIKDSSSGVTGIFICNTSDGVLTILSGITTNTKEETNLANIQANSFGTSNFNITIQGIVATEKYVDDSQTIKDLTHLTTQDEIYNAVEVSGWYKIKSGTSTAIMQCSIKVATQARLFGFKAGASYQEVLQLYVTPGTSTPFGTTVGHFVASTPITDTQVTTKKYVDDATKFKQFTIPAEYEYDIQLINFSEGAHTFTPTTGWEFVKVTGSVANKKSYSFSGNLDADGQWTFYNSGNIYKYTLTPTSLTIKDGTNNARMGGTLFILIKKEKSPAINFMAKEV